MAAARAGASAGIGLLAGVAFLLPVLAVLPGAPGRGRTPLLLLAALLAVLAVRRCGRLLRRVLDAAPRPWRLPLLGLYGLTALAVPAALLLR